jgi:hypothetical protein
LIAQPVAALHSVIGVPPPVVGVHVAQGCVDASLRGHRVRPRGEELGDAGSLEALLDKSEGSPEAGSSCAHHNCVEGVIDDGILLKERVLSVWGGTSASLERCWLPRMLKANRGGAVILRPALANNFIISLQLMINNIIGW